MKTTLAKISYSASCEECSVRAPCPMGSCVCLSWGCDKGTDLTWCKLPPDAAISSPGRGSCLFTTHRVTWSPASHAVTAHLHPQCQESLHHFCALGLLLRGLSSSCWGPDRRRTGNLPPSDPD